MSMLPQSAPLLYQPPDAEIVSVLASASAAWPTLESRIAKAQEILLSRGLQLEPVAWEVRNVVHWKIQSQTHAHGSYIVVGSSMGCNCPDRAQYVGNAKMCKHTIAVSAYRRILKGKLANSIANREVDLGILPNGEFMLHASRLGMCQVRKCKDGYTFVDATSAVMFSIWLARAEVMRWVTWQTASSFEMVAA